MILDIETPFSEWGVDQLNDVINRCLNEHDRLLRIPRLEDRIFRNKKREFVQPIVSHIYNEIFADGKFSELWLSYEEICRLWKFAREFVAYKIRKKEPGWAKDRSNGERRVFTGAAGHLAVLKSMGGSIKNMDLTIGDSKDYNLPDLKDWFGCDVGVKTASVIDYTPPWKRKIINRSNLPLVLDYKNFTEARVKKWKEDNTRFEERHGVESQIIVATKDFFRDKKPGPGREIYKTKCYILGIASPEVLINNASIAFTLDPNAADNNKPGGPKAGFYGLHKIEYFKTKEELINIASRADYQLVPYEDIHGHADLSWDYSTKQTGI